MNFNCVSSIKSTYSSGHFILSDALIQVRTMYNIKQIDYSQRQQVAVLQDFYNDLPQKPYCSLDKSGCYVNPKNLAINAHYIQPNHPAVWRWLCFDVDDSNALFAAHDNDLPPPQLILVNPKNGHAHLCYRLKTEVGLTGKSRAKPINYLRAIYHQLRRRLGADAGYRGNLIKNPFSDNWRVYMTGAAYYTLDELADLHDLQEPPSAANDVVFGRNVALFDYTRHIAYKIAAEHSYTTLLAVLHDIATEYNSTFDVSLFDNEVYTTCKSIARYCKSSRFNNGNVSDAHRETQRIRGSIGGKKSKRKPVATSKQSTKPWLELGISRATYYRDLNKNDSQK